MKNLGRFFRRIYPHLSLILAMCVITFAILDYFNPNFGFLKSNTSKICLFILGGICIINGVMTIFTRHERRNK
ncbi:MAG: hypothetical protein IJA35_04865 [Clostridia bacterium]|nr:hypothetical protein [Clostridia bacterium]